MGIPRGPTARGVGPDVLSGRVSSGEAGGGRRGGVVDRGAGAHREESVKKQVSDADGAPEFVGDMLPQNDRDETGSRASRFRW